MKHHHPPRSYSPLAIGQGSMKDSKTISNGYPPNGTLQIPE